MYLQQCKSAGTVSLGAIGLHYVNLQGWSGVGGSKVAVGARSVSIRRAHSGM